MASNRYCVEVAKRGTAGCKNCKQKIDKGLLRIAKIVPNPFTDAGGDMKQWYHAKCMFEALSRARATTKKIEAPDDLEDFDQIDDESKAEVIKLISEFSTTTKDTAKKTPKKPKKKNSDESFSTPEAKSRSRSRSPPKKSPSPSRKIQKPGKDDSFREFRRLCAKIAEESGYNKKTAIASEFFKNGSSGKGFDGDLYLWVKIFLPMVNKRVYNLQSKQLVKLFSQIFDASQEEMLEDLDQGDVAETVATFFESSTKCTPAKKSTITLQEVDEYLDELTRNTTEKPQMELLKKVAKRCTTNDLKIFIRLIKHDLRINAGPKHILEALHPTAYEAFQASRDLNAVVKQYLKKKESGKLDKDGLEAAASLMTPVLPMLAQPCRSFEDAFKKCPNGLYVEVKYDGERVQVHKRGNEFQYFSRSLKPVMPHKISHFKDFIPKAFPYGDDLILDSEILLVDNKGKPLPFGTLGAHKKTAFADATVCLFVFDCLQFNENNLMKKPFDERRKILLDNMKPVKNHVMFSEQRAVESPEALKKMMMSAIKQGLEGLLIKNKQGIYEPGKRHWLKMKKDYIAAEGMADSADLVVLGAFYGTGNKGGMKSIFLMGCLNTKTGKWCTVTKVGNGHDDATLERLQKELNMTKISKDANKVPSWLNVSTSLVPDFVIDDPEDSQVWEITGAEFSKSDVHTAGGISIRFPRVTRIRDDKTYKEATTLHELQELYKESKKVCELVGLASSPERERSRSASPDSESSKRKRSMSRERSLSTTPKKKSKNRSRSRSASKTRSRSRSGSRSRSKSKSNSSKRKRSKSPADKKSKSSGQRKSRSRSPKKSKVSENSSQKKSATMENKCGSFELSSIFSGVKLHIPLSLKDAETLRRYFVAFDGVLLREFDLDKASHVVGSLPQKNENARGNLKQVTPDWLWDSIKLQKLLPTKLYQLSAA